MVNDNDDPILIIINDADRIAFTRCVNKLRLIDRELHYHSHVHLPSKYDPIRYEVHASHQNAALTHILMAIQTAEEIANKIKDRQLRLEMIEDVYLRRLSFYDLFDVYERD